MKRATSRCSTKRFSSPDAIPMRMSAWLFGPARRRCRCTGSHPNTCASNGLCIEPIVSVNRPARRSSEVLRRLVIAARGLEEQRGPVSDVLSRITPNSCVSDVLTLVDYFLVNRVSPDCSLISPIPVALENLHPYVRCGTPQHDFLD